MTVTIAQQRMFTVDDMSNSLASDAPNLEVAGRPFRKATMGLRRSILVLDHDEDVLLRLEHLLETAGFDTTVTWRLDEVRQFIEQKRFDLVVIGHHPPHLDASRVLQLTGGGRRPACIVLHAPERFPFDAEYFYSLGAHAVLSKWGPEVAERVRQLFPPAQASA
jgi:CheY-like chemotaxis protein